jgi:hypothetical protein
MEETCEKLGSSLTMMIYAILYVVWAGRYNYLYISSNGQNLDAWSVCN